MIRGALGSRYGIGTLGRGVIRPQAGGWWLSGGIAAANCIAAYQPKGAASQAASYVNLNNPGTGDAVVGSAPGWGADTGWTFSGNVPYLKTPAINQSTGFIAIRFSNSATGSVCGHTLATGDRLFIQLRGSDVVYNVPGSSGYKTPAATAGILMLGYSGAYRNGVSESFSIAQPTSSAKIHCIGCAGNNGKPVLWWAGYVQAYAAYSAQLTQEQVTALYTAMAAL